MMYGYRRGIMQVSVKEAASDAIFLTGLGWRYAMIPGL